MINYESCANYTFTEENFDIPEGNVTIVNELGAGEGCWMQINRTASGSYGTVAIEYDSPYLYVFDDYIPTYESGEPLGLIEEQTAVGWGPRVFFVANGGLMPTRFNTIYTGAMNNLTLTSLKLANVKRLPLSL